MLNVNSFYKMKADQEKITMITAYDYPAAKQSEEAGIDMILVGDSLGMVVLGYASTTQVTMEDMVHHARAVRRGAQDTFMVVDMPFMSYHASKESAVQNAVALFQQSDAQAVKVEGASEETLALINTITNGGIPVVGHLGLTPQTVNVMGGYKVQGKDEVTSKKLLEDAKQLTDAGICMLVLECVPKELAALITESIAVPTIGIGAGGSCDGQVLVYHDLLQYGDHRLPKFVKSYASFGKTGVEAIQAYVTDVREKSFPEEQHMYMMKDSSFLPK